jgi:hypothetical protein
MHKPLLPIRLLRKMQESNLLEYYLNLGLANQYLTFSVYLPFCGNRMIRTFIKWLTTIRSTLELYFPCWSGEIRTHNPCIKSAVHLTIELQTSISATFRLELKTVCLCLPFRKKGSKPCYLYTKSHWLTSGIEPCFLHSQCSTLPHKLKSTFKVFPTRFELASSSRKLEILNH